MRIVVSNGVTACDLTALGTRSYADTLMTKLPKYLLTGIPFQKHVLDGILIRTKSDVYFQF